MNEMIDVSKLKTYSKPHKVYIPSKYGVFVERADLEKLLETAHNSDYAKCIEEIYKNEPTREYSREEIIDIVKKHFA